MTRWKRALIFTIPRLIPFWRISVHKPFSRRWMTSLLTVAIAAVALGAVLFVAAAWERSGQRKVAGAAAERGRAGANFDAIPLAFEANQGQTDPAVKYLARGNGYTAFLTADETVFAMRSGAHASARKSGKKAADKAAQAAIRIKLAGANPKPQIVAENELPGHSNYFIGNDPSKWQAGVKQFARIAYREIYPGVDMAFHGQQRQLEFDFVVAPGASTAPIRFGVSGANKIAADADGNLVLSAAAGDILLHKPVAYQKKNDAREVVDSRFVLAGNTVGFELGNFDHSRELVIDPSVSYTTYLGGNGEDDGHSIKVDGTGNAYVTGQTKSTNFPSASPANYKGGFDVFVSKLSSDGTSLIYSTYIGGSQDDSGNSIAVDSTGNAYVAGGTLSTDFPVVGSGYKSASLGNLNAFVLELNSTGTLSVSALVGGTLDDVADGIAVDGQGVYVVGSTASTDFPVVSAYQSSIVGSSNGFIVKLNTTLTTLAYSTYIGAGSGDVATAVAVDSSHNLYVVGSSANPGLLTTPGVVQPSNAGLSDVFVLALQASALNTPIYLTYLGGSNIDEGLGIAVDSSQDAYVTGLTGSSNFRTQSSLQTFKGTQDAFVAELNASGTALVYSTFLGGTGTQEATAIDIDSSKNAYVVGETNATDFPTKNPTQSALAGNGNIDAFVSEIAAGGSSLAFSTYLGGSGNENTGTIVSNFSGLGGIAVDSAGANIYVTGNTTSTNFPATVGQTGFGGGVTDAYVAKISTGASAANFSITDGALSNTSGHAGVSATATITVTSSNGFNSAVNLTCAVSPSVTKGPTCSLNPSSVTPTASGVTSTLTVATSAASARLEGPADHRGTFYAMLLPIFGIVILGSGMGSSGSRRRKWFGLLMLGLMLTGLLMLPACSSSSGGGGGSSGTPAGTYTITVTGTSGSATATGTPALTLTIN
jgi:hypothetical protein